MLYKIPFIAEIPGLQAALDARALLSGGNSWTGDQSFTGSIGLTKFLQVTGGTKVVSQPGGDFAETWNAGAVAFTALQVSVTDTASHATSKLVDLIVGGVSKFSVGKSGIIAATGAALSGALTGVGATFSGVCSLGNGVVQTGTLAGGEIYTLALSNAWSDGGTVFEALRCNITDGGSDAASLLFNLLLDSASKFSVSKAGNVTVAGTLAITGNIIGPATIAGGTVTNPSAPLTITQTWNDAADTMLGLVVSITDTASASASKLADFKVGGASKCSLDKSGNVTAAGYITAAGGGTLGASGSGAFGVFQVQWGNGEGIGYGGTIFRSGFRLTWSQYGNQASSGQEDTGLERAAAGVVKFTNGNGTLADFSARRGAISEYLDAVEMAAPAAPAANTARIYAEDSGGKTRLMVVFPSGSAQQIAIEP